MTLDYTENRGLNKIAESIEFSAASKNWLSKEYHAEWDSLRSIKQKDVQWLVKFYDLDKTKSKTEDKEKITNTISVFVKDVVKNNATLRLVQNVAPQLSKLMQQQTQENRDKTQGLDINND